MRAFISGKQSALLLLAGLCAAAGMVFLLHWFFAGPRLGAHYDFLSGRRSAPPVHRDTLLVETGEIVEAGDVFALLMALTEFDASGLVIEVSVLGSSSSGGGEDVRRMLDDEYALLGRNIRNLFDAIRTGSVPPSESQRYVTELIELAERGRERLASAVARREGADAEQTQRAAEVFSLKSGARVFDAPDLNAPPEYPETDEYYSRPTPDSDGVIRRVAPQRHIVYLALRPRLGTAEINSAEHGKVLTAGDFTFPLDSGENILIEKPRGADLFRRVDMDVFRAYAGADSVMRHSLGNAETLGFFSEIKPERLPSILYDYALSLRDDLLNTPSSGKITAWVHAREEYLASLDELLNGAVETNLVNAYEELIATEELAAEGIDKLRALRDELIASFAVMREQYGELQKYHAILETALESSFCIVGPAGSPVTETSAFLANALLTGRCITPGGRRYAVFWPLAAVFVLLLIIHFMRPVLLLISGVISGALCAIGFGWSFIVSGYWIDPLVPALSCVSGALVMFLIGFLIQRGGIRRFRFAYGPAVGKNCLKYLIRRGQPPLQGTVTEYAAVVAVKDTSLANRHSDDPAAAVRAALEFRSRVTAEFAKTGAVCIGCEGDIALMCFGSPPERIYLQRKKSGFQYADTEAAQNSGINPASRAAAAILSLARTGPASWHYGVDSGTCAFYWSARTGYTAHGRPLVRAKVLSSLTSRYNARVLVTNTAREKLNDLPVRKLHVLTEAHGEIRENFFELLGEENKLPENKIVRKYLAPEQGE